MTKEEVRKLNAGLYIAFWKDSGYSLMAVGVLHNGDRWFAATNWTSETDQNICGSGEAWEGVQSITLIAERNKDNKPVLYPEALNTHRQYVIQQIKELIHLL